jgi:hypothetical protein
VTSSSQTSISSTSRPHFKTHERVEGRKIWTLVSTETETKRDCADEGQQQFTAMDCIGKCHAKEKVFRAWSFISCNGTHRKLPYFRLLFPFRNLSGRHNLARALLHQLDWSSNTLLPCAFYQHCILVHRNGSVSLASRFTVRCSTAQVQWFWRGGEGQVPLEQGLSEVVIRSWWRQGQSARLSRVSLCQLPLTYWSYKKVPYVTKEGGKENRWKWVFQENDLYGIWRELTSLKTLLDIMRERQFAGEPKTSAALHEFLNRAIDSVELDYVNASKMYWICGRVLCWTAGSEVLYFQIIVFFHDNLLIFIQIILWT